MPRVSIGVPVYNGERCGKRRTSIGILVAR